MPLRSNMELKEYAGIFLRRKWMIIFSILFILFGASVYCVVVPEQYLSSTTILIVPQRVPENYVKSTVSLKIENRLATIRQQVLSRTYLMMVMDEFGLFKEKRKKRPTEEVIEDMRKRIDIQVKGTDSFMLSFQYENKQLAMLTTSRLASIFIDENLKVRGQQATGTSEFLDSQLQSVKTDLEKAENKVRQYKTRYMGELPQQMEANLNMLRGLQERYRSNSEAIRAAEDRRVFLEAQVSGLERSVQTVTKDSEKSVPVVAAGPDPARALIAEANEKRARLADLSARYTDKFPEIKRLKAEIEQLDRRIRDAQKGSPGTDNVATKQDSSGMYPSAQASADIREIRRLKEQIARTELEINSMKKERESIQNQMAVGQAKIDQAPKREQELISITRDYENMKRSYDDLLRKKLDADVSQNLEKRQKGEQFQILDPANLPDKPFKPNRMKVFAIAIMLSLLVGFGGVLGLEMLDPTLRGTKEFRQFFALPVLAAIPVFQDQKYMRAIALRKAAVLGGIVTFTLAVTLFILRFSDRIRAIITD